MGIETSKSQIMSTDDFLAHYGVKGMKWGKRKVASSEIIDARARNASRVRQISNQIDKTNLATGAQQKKEGAKLAKMQASYLKNPDRATALRMTTGEKAVLGVLAVAIPGVGTAAAAGHSGGRVLLRKSIEKDVARANSRK